MSQQTAIEWTDVTWNPIRGCTKISPGCAHCYAETFAERFRGVRGHPYEQGFDLRRVPEKLLEPFRLPAPKMVFVNSMSDLFHRDISDQEIISIVRVMERADWHTYQILTKRSDRMCKLLQTRLDFVSGLPHIWWGVSVEDRKHGLPRIEHLRSSPCGLRMLSVEPLLEDLGSLDLTGIGWVILGGESGPKARPLDASWVRNVRDACRRSGIPFFFKQWGGVRKGKNGRTLDGQSYDEMPSTGNRPMPDRKTRMAWIARIEEERVEDQSGK
ncbi:DUF5131 family protein [Tundrisphaera lichenicola]|uniref:DUF5131 family protein n=1 Tax=Tundrisphaera lichenicola TaxID=2029860 RepID=UPI003EB6DF47